MVAVVSVMVVGGVLWLSGILDGVGTASGTVSQYSLQSITTLVTGIGPGGGHLDWSSGGTWIAYDDVGSDGFTDVYKIKPDGTGKQCLTCNHSGLPNRHIGNSDWRPGDDARYLIFQAEKAFHQNDNYHWTSRPGSGYYNDLYLMDTQTNSVWQLTNVSDSTGGSLHAHFSRNGSKVMWGDLEGNAGCFGNWRMAVADFVMFPSPHLENIQYYEPARDDYWYETHEWNASASRIAFSCTNIQGMDAKAMDICVMDFATPNSATRLTSTSGLLGEPAEWDEHSKLAPADDVFAWVSSTPYGVQQSCDYGSWLKTDVWLMNANGTSKTRITYFNEPGHPEYLGRTIAADPEWNPGAPSANPKLGVSIYVEASNDIQIKILNFSRQ